MHKYIPTHVYIYTYIYYVYFRYTCVCVRVFINMHACYFACIYIYLGTYICGYAQMTKYMQVSMNNCKCLTRVFKLTFMCLYAFKYKYILFKQIRTTSPTLLDRIVVRPSQRTSDRNMSSNLTISWPKEDLAELTPEEILREHLDKLNLEERFTVIGLIENEHETIYNRHCAKIFTTLVYITEHHPLTVQEKLKNFPRGYCICKKCKEVKNPKEAICCKNQKFSKYYQTNPQNCFTTTKVSLRIT